ncbi:hypothetical protein MA16_Dca014675 [Dendrobium catenatum]|uniref:Uncharacterized protein n=1 Tax=Dendrobium catenatum TaxID=906689 RepID=A0A2I0W8U1_9ASPA|nr:hypothetical protein MA16_Dca014675 [Dendrobium catenatum]
MSHVSNTERYRAVPSRGTDLAHFDWSSDGVRHILVLGFECDGGFVEPSGKKVAGFVEVELRPWGGRMGGRFCGSGRVYGRIGRWKVGDFGRRSRERRKGFRERKIQPRARPHPATDGRGAEFFGRRDDAYRRGADLERRRGECDEGIGSKGPDHNCLPARLFGGRMHSVVPFGGKTGKQVHSGEENDLMGADSAIRIQTDGLAAANREEEETFERTGSAQCLRLDPVEVESVRGSGMRATRCATQ